MKKSVLLFLAITAGVLAGCSSYSKYAWQDSSAEESAQGRFPAGSGFCYQNENGAVVSGGKFGGEMNYQGVNYEEDYESEGSIQFYKNPENTCHVKLQPMQWDGNIPQVMIVVKDPDSHSQCPAEILGVYRDCHADSASEHEE